ncbi:hypothetical protein GCM10012285_37170 [Streptomyces kronopolitis]|uniref:Uncharacterized protein n=1 Tax=Streptomyces kronopolitis TaxID=1612435 RepID=A0ABQ2JN50_9ACTN|nr:hypothetical protein GCM10012285_37170 [Streptomyces kronopolitis]
MTGSLRMGPVRRLPRAAGAGKGGERQCVESFHLDRPHEHEPPGPGPVPSAAPFQRPPHDWPTE